MQGFIAVHTQAAHAQRVHVALGEVTGEEANLNAVVELMLDITESTVAFCWELGAGKLQAAITGHTSRCILAVINCTA